MDRLKSFGFYIQRKITSDTSDFPDSKIDENAYRREMERRGITGVMEKISNDMNEWRNMELHIAVTGVSGAGKSSFINAIRGITSEDEGAAEVGFNQTTKAIKRYPHPENESFVVWDLPGAGTKEFPQSDYLRLVEFNKYDAFIIISKDRFTEIDSWLANEVRKQQKSFFFVRAKIDNDIKSDKEEHPKSHNAQNVLSRIRTVTEDLLLEEGIMDPKVFLISNRKKCRYMYDFGLLNNELLASSDGLKKDAMALSLAAITKEVIKEKKRVLERRIVKIALIVTGTSDEVIQKLKFQEEVTFYQKQFNIDDNTLAENKEILSLSDENVEGFKVVFDEDTFGYEMQVETPTARRQGESMWERFKDWFAWSKKERLLYKFCVSALGFNLDILYQKANALYDVEGAKKMVHGKLK